MYSDFYNSYPNFQTEVSNMGIDEGVAVALFAILGVIIVIALTFFLICWVLKVVGRYKMFEKANVPGWKAIIPIYNTYTHCQIVGVNVYWILISIIASCFTPFAGPFSIVAYIIDLYFAVLIALSTAKSYGKSEGFGIGLFFLAPIFYMILGFGKNEYLGPKPINDIIFSNDNPKPVVKEDKQCVKCGSNLREEDKFCPYCGESQYKSKKKATTKKEKVETDEPKEEVK